MRMNSSKNPGVTVLIPTYNRARFLPKAIDSVFEQTYSNFEIIVVDDGSTDETTDLLSKYKDKRLRILKTQNQGVSKARNLGISQSNSQSIAFLDSDDFWYPNKLEVQLELISDNVGLVYCSYILESRLGKIPMQARFSGLVENEFYRNPTVAIVGAGMSTAVIKKSVLLEINGFDVSVPPPSEDYDLFWRISKITEFKYVSEPLAQILIHENNVSSNLSQYHKGNIYVLNKMIKGGSMTTWTRIRMGMVTYLMLVKSYLKAGEGVKGLQTLYSSLVFLVTRNFLRDRVLSKNI